MSIPIWTASIAGGEEQAMTEIAAGLCETKCVNLPSNSDSARQQEILDALPALVFLERAGKVVFANAEARRVLGQGEGRWAERPVEDVLWGLFAGTAEPQTQLIGTHSASPFHAMMPTRSGKLMPVEGIYNLLDAERREAIIVAHASGRVQAPRSTLMEDVLASIPEAVVIVHGDHVLYTNPAFTQMFGYTAEEAGGNQLRELIVPETRRHELAMLEKEVEHKGRVALDTVRMNKGGELLDVSMVAAPLKVDGSSIGCVLSFRDISERTQAEAMLQQDAFFDFLTGLPNRALFLDRLTQSLRRKSRHGEQNCGLLLFDIDSFGQLKGTLGVASADALLQAVAERLRGSLRPHDSAARLGAEAFAVLVENIVGLDDLRAVATRILGKLQEPFKVFGCHVHVTASMGAATAAIEHTAALLLTDAESALNRARLEGGGKIEIFDRQAGAL